MKKLALILGSLFAAIAFTSCAEASVVRTPIALDTNAEEVQTLVNQETDLVESQTERLMTSFEHSYFGMEKGKWTTPNLLNVNDGERIRFSSNNRDVAEIDWKTGEIYGRDCGVATLTARCYSQSGEIVQTLSTTVEVNGGYYTSLDMNESFIRWQGRTFYEGGVVNCFDTASGFTTTFYGTMLKAKIQSAGYVIPRICVLVDGKVNTMENMIRLTKSNNTYEYTLASGLEEGFHTVRVYKITEACSTAVAFKTLRTDGYFYLKPEERDLKIEVYGDSITAGYRNLRPTEKETTAAAVNDDLMQNGCLTYAWLAAEQLNADVQIHARTGIGINWSWGADITMAEYWDNAFCGEMDFFGYGVNPDWDFTRFTPDMVVVNVGTNDFWTTEEYGGYDRDAYVASMKTLCENILTKYGADTPIVLCYGVMVTGNGEALEEVAASFTGGVYTLQLPAAKPPEYHPRRADAEAAADVLAAWIEEYFAN